MSHANNVYMQWYIGAAKISLHDDLTKLAVFVL